MNKKIDKVIGILKNKYVHNGTLSEKHFVDIASKYDISILDMIRIQELLYEDGIDIKTSDNDSENDNIHHTGKQWADYDPCRSKHCLFIRQSKSFIRQQKDQISVIP